ncbi:MAG: alanine dehydrogenase, partial [Demequinaceae bacterium]|nr:alanine dehydrogenase [Demequinaceae bacterium]
PTYRVEGSVFYCVANMPGAVGYTSTLALTNATLPYAVALANHGWAAATAANPALAKGLAVVNGRILNAPTAQAFPHLPAA